MPAPMDLATMQQLLPTLLAACVEEGDCLLWGGAFTANGYPYHSHHGQKVLARRLVWAATHGRLPEGGRHVVADTCDNRRCVKPQHLVLMPRSAVVVRSYGKRNLLAEYGKRQAALVNSGRAKLSLEVARQMRCDERTHQQLADALGVSASLVAKIRRGEIWREPAGVFSGLLGLRGLQGQR